ncbi:glutathione S-transferase N-terminal domain-containing protein, partial [Acinetobacter baumannii]|nr:glutathione S-transferase N-terminal domain-containing protein [Acinetobacter baumannii]ELA6730835.1 glutathione S-transferase N-terminal domain-containing protein [Acinetobacter baumannii]ELC9198383.1 glutathione S-transferase N-terminal domain-containing protein [Acinetobacter baumannii]ELQ5472354.1 glutathione S-transferase N-terminal domain-containing protein [Acinetobacter baumannii]ELY1751627.1 glutathione S-transferase N-terminal domain-containing protein [Acinetobacter baumannii]
FEASPYSRVVRSVLSELELPYILHSVAKERWQDMGPAILRLKPGKYEPLKEGKREKLLPVMQGKMQVPYLVDPNTGVKMFESAEIVKYLKKQYGS